MAGLFTNFAAVVVASATMFGNSFSEINMEPPADPIKYQQDINIDLATSLAQTTDSTYGIVVIDRAKKNKVYNSGATSHKQFELGTLGRLPILLYAARIDPKATTGKDADIIAMTQGASTEATNRLWDRYGGEGIIRDLAARYQLSETRAGSTWSDTASSPMDIARMTRRFLDDKAISVEKKKWVLGLLAKTSPIVAGDDYTWGLPQSVGLGTDTDFDGQRLLSWMQGWARDDESITRNSVGVVGEDMRFIVVDLGVTKADRGDSVADDVANKVADAVVSGDGSEKSPILRKDEDDPGVTEWVNKMKDIYKLK